MLYRAGENSSRSCDELTGRTAVDNESSAEIATRLATEGMKLDDRAESRSLVYRRWLFRCIRFSLVVGVLAAALNAWMVFATFTKDRDRAAELQRGYECASKKPDQLLKERSDGFGNINIRELLCSDRDFIVSMPELVAVRSGQLEFKPTSSPTNPLRMMMMGIIAMLATMLVTGGLLVISVTVNWVWGTRA